MVYPDHTFHISYWKIFQFEPTVVQAGVETTNNKATPSNAISMPREPNRDSMEDIFDKIPEESKPNINQKASVVSPVRLRNNGKIL
jgi:hypothetical protein